MVLLIMKCLPTYVVAPTLLFRLRVVKVVGLSLAKLLLNENVEIEVQCETQDANQPCEH